MVIGALTTTNTSPKLYESGDAYATGAWNTASDQRLKDDITEVLAGRGLAVIMSLNPKEWIWNEKSSLYGKRGAGFIAQEIEGVLPFAVVNDGGFMGMNYQALQAYEVACLQDHERRLARVEDEIKKLVGYGA